MAAYVGADLARFLMSVQLVPDPGRTLEIGANPYFITRLLAARYPDADLTLTNFFGTDEAAIDQEVVDAAGTVVGVFHSDLLDVETQPLPYPDGGFDTVLLCEVIEHMVSDPVFVLREIHRVLAPRGRLLLTTPNVARAANLHRLAQRQGIYDPYSAYGPHGRHNREYVAEELHELLVRNGFRIERYLTRPVHDVPDPGPEWFAAADDDGAGDYHFVVAVRAAHPRSRSGRDGSTAEGSGVRAAVVVPLGVDPAQAAEVGATAEHGAEPRRPARGPTAR